MKCSMGECYCPPDTAHIYNETCEDDSFENCGDHGNNCALRPGWAASDCVNKQCKATKCSNNYQLEGDNCILQNVTPYDDKYCGDDHKICLDGQMCLDGECKSTSCESGTTPCEIHQNGKLIDYACYDLNSDINHCGDCSKVCVPQPSANMTCKNGECVYTCQTGYISCGDKSAPNCRDTNSDKDNCGECGKKCGDQQLCLNSVCCNNDGICDGKCVNLTNNKNNCGGCGNKCEEYESCCNGSCTVLANDKNNCGMCGIQCGGQLSCVDGNCAIKYGTCKGKTVDLSTDNKNCGHCGNQCAQNKSCCNGACTNLKVDVANCGQCGNKCSSEQPMCLQGACCRIGQQSCNGKCVYTISDNSNCG